MHCKSVYCTVHKIYSHSHHMHVQSKHNMSLDSSSKVLYQLRTYDDERTVED